MKLYKKTGPEGEIESKERNLILEGYCEVEGKTEKDLLSFEYMKTPGNDGDITIAWLER